MSGEPNITERLAQALESIFPEPVDVLRLVGFSDASFVTLFCTAREAREAFAALAAYRGRVEGPSPGGGK